MTADGIKNGMKHGYSRVIHRPGQPGTLSGLMFWFHGFQCNTVVPGLLINVTQEQMCMSI